MAKLTITTFLTLDGVMQAPGGPQEDTDGSFEYGGWSFPYADGEFAKFMADVFTRADAFLLGRRTYDIFAGYWPKVTDPSNPIAGPLNTLPKYVASKTLKNPTWASTTVIREVAKEVPGVKKQYARELQVHGSSRLAQALIENDLVDELNLLVYPVVLGKGKRLFGPGAVPAAFTLTGSRTTSKGVVISTYKRAGKPTFGSF